LLESLLPPAPDAETLASLLPLLEADLIREARPALQQSEEVVQTIALAIATAPSLGWQPLTANLTQVTPTTRARALDAAKHIVSALTPEFIVQSTHPNLAVRMAAARVLATQESDQARAAVEAVLAGGDEETCRAVLATLSDFPNPALLHSVAKLLNEKRPWPLRQLAAATLHTMGNANPKAAADGVADALLASAEHDSNAFVREQALRAWFAWRREQSKPVLARVAKSDPEERVRRVAEALLEGRE
jgi:HEAT repeat protein